MFPPPPGRDIVGALIVTLPAVAVMAPTLMLLLDMTLNAGPEAVPLNVPTVIPPGPVRVTLPAPVVSAPAPVVTVLPESDRLLPLVVIELLTAIAPVVVSETPGAALVLIAPLSVVDPVPAL